MNSGPEDAARSRRAFVALGSNQGDSVGLLREAGVRLEGLSRSPLRRSSLWRSTPVDCPPGSPAFLNAVVALEPLPGTTPESLLLELQAIERALGRRPKRVLNEPRPLDLDLIAFGEETRQSEQLTLPHPRAHWRRFVLEPLAEIAPDLILPGQRQSVREQLETLSTPEKLERVSAAWE